MITGLVTLAVFASCLITALIALRMALDHDRRKTLLRQDHEFQMEMLRHEHRISEPAPVKEITPVASRTTRRVEVSFGYPLTHRDAAEIVAAVLRRF